MRVPPYAWPTGKRCAVMVCVLFDDGLDALYRAPELAQRSKSFSVWEYGALRGVERLIATFAEFGTPSTWFLPGIVADRHKDLLGPVVAAGHELASRGWGFERYDDAKALDQLARSRQAIAALGGGAPAGFRLPAGTWPIGFDRVLRQAGFAWSASLNGDDRPYSHDSGLVEIPVHLELEDRPYFQFNFNPPFPKGLSRLPSYEGVLRNWLTEFDAYREHGLCFVLQLRPEMIATPGRIFILRDLLEHVSSFDDVWIARGSEIADWHVRSGAVTGDEHPIRMFATYRRENRLDV